MLTFIELEFVFFKNHNVQIIIWTGAVIRSSDQPQRPITNSFPIKGCVSPVKDIREAWSCVSSLMSLQTLLLDPQSEIRGFETSFNLEERNNFRGERELRIEERSLKGTGIHPEDSVKQHSLRTRCSCHVYSAAVFLYSNWVSSSFRH